MEDFKDNKIVIIVNGKRHVLELPDYGELKIITHQGEVRRVVTSESLVLT